MNQQLATFWHLLKADIVIFKKSWFTQVLDNLVWISMISLATTHILPLLGIAKNFGPYCAIGTIASCATFRILSYASMTLADIDGDNVMSYYITLPISIPLVFLKTCLAFAIQTASIGIVILPWIKLLLGNRLDLSSLSIMKFIGAFTIINLFYAFFSLLTAALAKRVSEVTRIWARFIFPCWYLGGFQFSWNTLHQLSPKVAQCNLVNPFLYASEIIHSAVLGSEGYLSFSLCFFALSLATVICFIISHHLLKKRLDSI